MFSILYFCWFYIVAKGCFQYKLCFIGTINARCRIINESASFRQVKLFLARKGGCSGMVNTGVVSTLDLQSCVFRNRGSSLCVRSYDYLFCKRIQRQHSLGLAPNGYQGESEKGRNEGVIFTLKFSSLLPFNSPLEDKLFLFSPRWTAKNPDLRQSAFLNP